MEWCERCEEHSAAPRLIGYEVGTDGTFDQVTLATRCKRCGIHRVLRPIPQEFSDELAIEALLASVPSGPEGDS